MSPSSNRPSDEGTPDPARTMDASGVAAKELDPELALAMEQISRSLFPLGEATEVRIGRFVVERRLGAGAMGVVYAARDPVLDRRVAIKLVRPEVGSDRKAQLRLEREARALAKVSHPNIVAIHEVGEHRGQLFLAMEHVQGQSLRAWQEREARSRSAVLAMYMQAGRGLAAAHAVGLVHRDFKPDNVLVDDQGRARVVDFGLVGGNDTGSRSELARWQASQEQETPLLTQTHAWVGTPSYMSPEQFRGAAVDARSDQFAFCVALWEALYGERPFEGRSLLELSARVLTGRLRPPSKERRVPSWLRQACERGLAVDPAQRFGSMDELLAALAADPSRRRRRMLLTAGGSLAIVLGIGAYTADRARRVQACADEAASIAEVWGDAARERVETSLLSTGASFAPSTWERVEPRLDEYATAWSEAREATCLAAEVEGTRTEDLATRTNDCLNEHRDALASLVEVLGDADATVVQSALTAVSKLTPPEACTDESNLARRMQPPADAEVRQQVEDLRRRLADARSLSTAGRYRQGLALAREIADETKALGWGPLHAEALLQVGILAREVGELEPAERVLEQAVDLALREGDDYVAASAIEALTLITGSSLARHERGIWWSRLGLALAAGLGSTRDRQQASISRALAIILTETGAYAEARELLEQALANREQAFGTTAHPELGYILVALAHVRLQEGALAEAEELYERSLVISEAAFGRDHPNTAVVLANIGIVLQEQGKLEAALTQQLRALAIHEEVFGPRHLRVADTLNAIGNVLLRQGKLEAALTQQQRALAIYEEVLPPRHPRIALSHNNIGAVLQYQGKLEDALAHHQRALVLREEALGPRHLHVASSLRNLARVELMKHDPEAAREHAERAVAICEASETSPRELADARFVLARALWPDREQRLRSHALAQQARDAYAGYRGAEEELAEVQAWLADHPVP